MAKFVKGDVVVIPLLFSDLSQSKKRHRELDAMPLKAAGKEVKSTLFLIL